MKLLAFSLSMSALVLAAGAGEPKGFDKYPLVQSRPVFDPERRPVNRPSSRPTQSSSSGSRFSSATTLTGTMSADGKQLAFFASPRGDGNRVLPVNESIGNYKIVNITSGVVEVEHEGKRTVLSVGESLPNESGTAGAPAAAAASGTPEPPAPNGEHAANPNPDDPAAPALPAGNGKDDVLRRMMERRQKEMSR